MGRLRFGLQAPLRQRRGPSMTSRATISDTGLNSSQNSSTIPELVALHLFTGFPFLETDGLLRCFRGSTPGHRAVQILYEPFHFSAILQGMFLTGTSGHAAHATDYTGNVILSKVGTQRFVSMSFDRDTQDKIAKLDHSWFAHGLRT